MLCRALEAANYEGLNTVLGCTTYAPAYYKSYHLPLILHRWSRNFTQRTSKVLYFPLQVWTSTSGLTFTSAIRSLRWTYGHS